MRHVICLLLLAACARYPAHRTAEAPPETVAVDLHRYQGVWYEIMRYPNRFEEGCVGVTAEYTLRPDGRVAVVNACRRGGLDGAVDAAEGVARRVGEGRLEVKFAPSWVPFGWGDYWVLALEPDYSAALVGSPDGQFLWVLSREPALPERTLARLLETARAQGYDPAALTRTPQPPA